MKRYCLTLDLINDPEMILKYEEYHKEVWPEIIDSIKGSGIKNMQIYRYETRLCLVMEVNENFSFEKNQQADMNNTIVQKWEELMWKYQRPLDGSLEGEKWKLMEKIFELIEF